MNYHSIPTLYEDLSSIINGKEVGYFNRKYIQEFGLKEAGRTYIDKNTGELFLCIHSTNGMDNDSNFVKFNLKEAFRKLDKLDDSKKKNPLSWTFLGTIRTTNGTLKVPDNATECLVYTRDVTFSNNEWVMSSHLIKTDFDIGPRFGFGQPGQIYFSYTKSNRIIRVSARGQGDESIDVFYR